MTDQLDHRVRFVACRVESPADDVTRAVVVLENAAGRSFEGAAEHEGSDGDLWSTAHATTHALRQALGLPEAALRLRDVTAFEISESPAVAVALRLQVEGPRRRLFGLSQMEDDRGRAAAIAVLGATNRILSKA